MCMALHISSPVIANAGGAQTIPAAIIALTAKVFAIILCFSLIYGFFVPAKLSQAPKGSRGYLDVDMLVLRMRQQKVTD